MLHVHWYSCHISDEVKSKIEPEITIVNYGEQAVDIIYVNYTINNGESLSFEWTGNLNSQVSSTTITLPAIATVEGKNNLTFSIHLAIDVAEPDNLNNLAQQSFNKLPVKDFPYIETFEDYTNTDLENSWAISNDDFGITWRIDSTGGIESSN